ncbi:MAG: major royal jelly family protein [archaeon]|nr:major royal jelly family protein [archaeon]
MIILILLMKILFISSNELEAVAKWNVTKFLINNTIEECRTCLPAGIKLYGNKTFISFPRWKENVPATIGLLTEYDNESVFTPWPNLEENKIGDPNKLQSVLGFEIYNDTIFILDQGKVNGSAAIENSIKVSKYNITTGELLHIYRFDETIANLTNSFLNDIVISPHINKAFISDSGIGLDDNYPMNPGIIVLDLNYNETNNDTITNASAFRMLLDEYTLMPDDTFWLRVDGHNVNVKSPMRTGVDGIALSCDFKYLYYTPLSSRVIYGIHVGNLDKDKNNYEINKGYKGFASDGLAYSTSNNLYFTDIENGAIHKVSVENAKSVNGISFLDSTSALVNGSNTTMWPDTIAINEEYLYFVSNQLNYFNSEEIDFDNPKFGDSNFRIYRIKIQNKEENYIIGCEGPSNNITAVFMWIIIGLLIMVILSFVLMSSHKQEEGVDKNMTIGVDADEIEN